MSFAADPSRGGGYPPGSAPPRGAAALRDWAGLGAVLITSTMLVQWALASSRSGFDFTDESFYLVWIADPGIYKVSVYLFGFVYHPLYLLVDGDLARLRQFNILITLGLAFGLGLALFRATLAVSLGAEAWRSPPFVGLALALSTGSLTFAYWLGPTPSYNSLALQGLLIAATGFVLADRGGSRPGLVGWALIGLGGWVAFMAKPTTAAALGAVLAVCLAAAGKLRLRCVALSLAVAGGLLLASALAIDGSLRAFADRLRGGARDLEILAGGHTLASALRIDRFALGGREKLLLLESAALVALTTRLSLSASPIGPAAAAAAAVAAACASLAVILGFASPDLPYTDYRVLQALALPLGLMLLAAAGGAKRARPLLTRENLALAALLAVLPHVYAFGTITNYWQSGSCAAIFWILLGLVFFPRTSVSQAGWRAYLPLTAALQVLITLLVYLSLEHPYRQPQPLRMNQELLRLPGTGAEIRVPGTVAGYVRRLDELAAAAGFRRGDPMIDLTGYAPGALYALGARSVGRAWIIGAYQGSRRLATAVLDRVACEEIARSWILTEPGGPRELPAELLLRYGIDLERDYVAVGTVSSPPGARGHAGSYREHLLKPARSPEQAREACESRRALRRERLAGGGAARGGDQAGQPSPITRD